jgi:hypothetical protein
MRQQAAAAHAAEQARVQINQVVVVVKATLRDEKHLALDAQCFACGNHARHAGGISAVSGSKHGVIATF